MQWSLVLVVLMGQCFFVVCHLYEYKLISENMTWEAAKNYCKDKHTDLATVFDMNDMGRLNQTSEAWIGLRRDQINRTWYWSLPGVEFSKDQTKWNDNEPDDNRQNSNGNCYNYNEPNNGGQNSNENCLENCVVLGPTGGWYDDNCDRHHPFICYDVTESQQVDYHFIDQPNTWQQAQSYCRDHYTDLVSGFSQVNDSEFNKTWQSNGKKDVWIGLFRDKWSWSDGSRFSFRNWQDTFPEEESEKCAVTTADGKWKTCECRETKPFYCYEDNMILIPENKTWEEALTHCRENYNELVSITNLTEQHWVQEKAKKATSPYVWLGLRYTCTLGFWFWVTDEVVSYKNWESPPEDDCNLSGAMDKQGEHKWVSHDDEQTYNFICSKN